MGAKTMIALARPSIGDEEWHALRRPIERGWVMQGGEVKAFEEEFAAHHQLLRAVAVCNGTAALHLALWSLGLRRGEKVLVPAFTFVATANAVRMCGAIPVLCDIDLATYGMDPARAAEHRGIKTAIVVHEFGLCAHVPAIREVLPHTWIVEDAACAVGASAFALPAGRLGHLSAFSFHPRKVITTGEGGMIGLHLERREEEMFEELRKRRSHGDASIGMVGMNYRMTDMQAAMGRVQLTKLSAFLKGRREIAKMYDEGLKDVEWLTCPVEPKGFVHTYQSYVIRLSKRIERTAFMERLAKAGIETAVGGVPWSREIERFPHALEAYEHTVCLPMHNGLMDRDVEEVIECIRTMEP